jgi:pyruvate/2-oxoglutarate dehydrogenase complex dihydrolipoamide acyltransferase (E2) component
MIRDVIMPQLAMGMSEGTIVEWAAAEGERISREVRLLAIETEKVVTDIPAPSAGWLHRMAEMGKAIPVETVIARIADSEAEYRTLLGTGEVVAPAARPAEAALAPVATPELVAAPEALGQAGRVRASGLAKKIASAHGIDLSTVTGSGPSGRIVRRDVLATLESGTRAVAPASSPVPGAGALPGMRVRARVPVTGMRKAIAERMLRSKTTSAHTYVFFEVDVTRLIAVRTAILAREKELQTRVSMTAFYAKALAIALRRVPNCNARLAAEEVVIWDNVNIGIAVALPGRTEYESGLVVPVVRNVEGKGVLDLDREIKTLVEKAKAGRLNATDTSDGTVTLSSSAGFMPGQWCVSTPLLNQPQVLNFQPGSPIEKPVVIDGQVVIRTMLPCGLSFDHRAVDGEPVARFNRAISDLLSNPELMLL